MTLLKHQEYYQNNKALRDAQHRTYVWKHREQIAEMERHAYYKKRGLKVKPKPFSFYRDVVRPAFSRLPIYSHITETDRQQLYQQLMGLRLTKRQRQLVKLSYYGLTMEEIARELKITQSSITMMWSGCFNYKYNKVMGGIYRKWQKAYSHEH